ncbi:MAG: hypothetical protein K6G50_01975 [bacterium]|nr:hypothetical protein [bacterium]
MWAIEASGEKSSSEKAEDEAALQLCARLADWAVSRRLTAPFVFLLESGRPFAFLGSQAMAFFEPMVRSFLNPAEYNTFMKILEDRVKVDYLLELIEEKEQA